MAETCDCACCVHGECNCARYDAAFAHLKCSCSACRLERDRGLEDLFGKMFGTKHG